MMVVLGMTALMSASAFAAEGGQECLKDALEVNRSLPNSAEKDIFEKVTSCRKISGGILNFSGEVFATKHGNVVIMSSSGNYWAIPGQDVTQLLKDKSRNVIFAFSPLTHRIYTVGANKELVLMLNKEGIPYSAQEMHETPSGTVAFTDVTPGGRVEIKEFNDKRLAKRGAVIPSSPVFEIKHLFDKNPSKISTGYQVVPAAVDGGDAVQSSAGSAQDI